jgi:hypothetical protein
MTDSGSVTVVVVVVGRQPASKALGVLPPTAADCKDKVLPRSIEQTN